MAHDQPAPTSLGKRIRPTISAIMPTTNRRLKFLPLSIDRLKKQEGVDRVELIVVTEDDEAAEQARLLISAAELLGEVVLCNKDLTIGAKRNIACEVARGPWITHWDDDDWSRKDRLASTLSVARSDVDVIGTSTMLVHELVAARRQTSVYKYIKRADDPSYPDTYFIGGLLTYRKTLWHELKFDEEQPTGEETWWQLALIAGRDKISYKAVECGVDPTLYVSMLHGKNTAYQGSAIPSGDPTMIKWTGDLAGLMGEDLARWEIAAGAS